MWHSPCEHCTKCFCETVRCSPSLFLTLLRQNRTKTKQWLLIVDVITINNCGSVHSVTSICKFRVRPLFGWEFT